MIDAFPEGFLVADGMGVLKFINRPGAALLSSTVTDLLGKPLQINPDQTQFSPSDNPEAIYAVRWLQLMWEGNQAWVAFFLPSSGNITYSEPSGGLQSKDEVSELQQKLLSLQQRFDQISAQNGQNRQKAEEFEKRALAAESKGKEGEDVALEGWSTAEERAKSAEANAEKLQAELDHLQLRLQLAQETEVLLKSELVQACEGKSGASDEEVSRQGELIAEQQERISLLEQQIDELKSNAAPMSVENVPEHYVQIGQLNNSLEEASARNQELQQEVYTLQQQLQEFSNQSQELENSLTQRIAEMASRDRETKRLAFEDPLTGLANNNILNQYIAYTLDLVRKGEGAAMLLVVDIDRLRTINITAGHQVGDQILMAFGERLRSYARATDVLARRRADEYMFVVTLQNSEPEAKGTVAQMAQALAQKIVSGLEEPFNIEGSLMTITCAMGLTMFSGGNDTADSIIDQAYIALARAKEMGRNRFYFFGQDLAERARRRTNIIPRLKDALERNEFVLYYQPVLDLKTGRIVGLESLLRWHDPSFGLLEPKDFLQFAEDSGMILPIGEWAIGEACQMASQQRDLFVSVNVSMRQVLQSDFVRRFMKQVERARVRPEKIIVEISETTSNFDPDRVAQAMSELAYWKIGLAIDDFGTASTPIQRLLQEHLKVVKLDITLVKPCVTDQNVARMLFGTVSMINAIKLQAHAEGVETAEQLAFLKKIGCHMAQGTYISPPVTATAVKDVIKKTYKV